MNRFISVVAGSLVSLTVKSSQSVTVCNIGLLSVDSPRSILTNTGADGVVSSPSIIAMTLKVWTPLPRTGYCRI